MRSPGDETVERLSFFAGLGVPEVWIVDRDMGSPRVLRLATGGYEELADREGWFCSAATSVRRRAEPDQRLAMQLGDDTTTGRRLPESFGASGEDHRS